MSETADTIRGGDEAIQKSGGAGQFIKETREELNKTSFPSGEDVRNTTVIVIANVIFFAIFLFIVDWAWVFLLGDPADPKGNTGLTWLLNKLAGL